MFSRSLKAVRSTTISRTFITSRISSNPNPNTGGLLKPIQLSPLLSSTLNVTNPITRPQTTKKLWEYIKANNMQDPNDGRQIINNSVFREIFECEKMSMFEMTKLVQKHIIK
jgi:chromatin remodeling complex protein RSC6